MEIEAMSRKIWETQQKNFIIIDTGSEYKFYFINELPDIADVITSKEDLKEFKLREEFEFKPKFLPLPMYKLTITSIYLNLLDTTNSFIKHAIECSEMLFDTPIKTNIPVYAANLKNEIMIESPVVEKPIVMKMGNIRYNQKPSNRWNYSYGTICVGYFYNTETTLAEINELIKIHEHELNILKSAKEIYENK